LAQFDAAVIGLGAIGLPVSINLSRSFTVQGWNRSPVDHVDFKNSSVQLTEKLSDLSTSNYLIVVSDEDSIHEILDNGLFDVLNTDDLLVVMSTISPDAMHSIQGKIQTKGARVIDAPVSGGDVGAQRGELSIMLAGDPNDCARAEKLLAKTAKSIRNVGSLGKAQTLKACNQIIVGAHLVALAESLALARRNGISDQDFFDVISQGLAGSTVLNTKWEKVVSGDFTKGGKSDYQLKDLNIALDIAKRISLTVPLTETVTEIYRIQKELGYADLDHSSVLLQYLDSNDI
jgi:2-hydroxy-3-oxopropionate reductase